MKSKIIEDIRRSYLMDPTSQCVSYGKIRDWIKDGKTKIIINDDIVSISSHGNLLLRLPITQGYDHLLDNKYKTLSFKDQQIIRDAKEERFFKLYHNHENLDKVILPSNYRFREVKLDECEGIVNLINNSYEHISVSKSDVNDWSKKKSYDSGLWIWIEDISTDEKVALGIADLDLDIGEGYLEWIQVNKNYTKKGFGKLLVNELLFRISKKGVFTTVAGDYDNESNPEKLYRSCGFIGDAIWHYYKRT